MDTSLADISHVIQLAVAPVFLLTAIATLINALNVRLGRVVDRRRIVQDRLDGSNSAEEEARQEEIRHLVRRSTLVYQAIFCAVLSALLVCLVVAAAFVGTLFGTRFAGLVAALFIAAMFAMVAALGLLLREVYVAVRSATHRRH